MLLSAGLYASGWPEQIKAHPLIVFLIFAVGALLLALGLWLTRKKTETQPPLAVPPPSVHAPVNVQVSPVFNPVFSPVQSNQQIVEAPRPTTQAEPQRSTLQVMKPVFEQLCPVRGGWHVSAPGQVLGAVAWVHNPTAEEGEIGTLVRSARASLAYRKEGHLMFTIEAAYWLEESGYEIDLKPGMARGIVLALFPAGTDTPYWFGSQNHRRDRIATPRPGGILHASSPQYVNFGVPDEIEISIVSKQRTVRKVTFVVGRDERSFYEFSLGGNEI